jgi:Fic family protein
MKPPYDITNRILTLIASISEKIGEVNSAHLNNPPTELRKKNRIKTIQATLAIEGNTLTIDQITDLLNHKRVLAPRKDIIEVKNAIEVYSKLDEFDVYSLDSLRSAHAMLMHNLVDFPGQLRSTPVGIIKGKEVTHIAPPGRIVHSLLTDLFEYLTIDDDLLIIKSCVFHYVFEFIHPFLDGNGRMGRLWQTMILREHSRVFAYLSIETLIKEHQQEYYNALERSDNNGNSTVFIEYMLEIIQDALEDLLKIQNVTLTGRDRMERFRDIIGLKYFTRQDYLRTYREISPSTASRDLKAAVSDGLFEMHGDKRTAEYVFVTH